MVGNSWGRCVPRTVWCQAVLGFAALSVSPFLAAHATETKLQTITHKTEESTSAVSQPASLDLTPSEIRFVDVPVGEAYTQMVRVTNSAEGAIQIKKIVVPGTEFRVTGVQLPFVVAHGTSDHFTVVYRPKAQGRTAGRLLIYTSQSAEPVTMELTAASIAGLKELAASDASLDFADVALGSRSLKTVSLTNTGNRQARIEQVSISGGEFAVSGLNAATLAAGQTVTLEVSFAPHTLGARTATLKIVSAGQESLEIPLTATGAPGSQTAIRLQWEASPASVAGYVVYRSADATGPFERISLAASPEYVDTGLPAGHTYYYVVTTIAADESESEFSEPISATVPEG